MSANTSSSASPSSSPSRILGLDAATSKLFHDIYAQLDNASSAPLTPLANTSELPAQAAAPNVATTTTAATSDDNHIAYVLSQLSMTELYQWNMDGCLFQGYSTGESHQGAAAALSATVSPYDMAFAQPYENYLHVRPLRMHHYWYARYETGPPFPPLQVLHYALQAPCDRHAALVECEWLEPFTHRPYMRTENGVYSPAVAGGGGVAEAEAAALLPYRILLFAPDWPSLCVGAIYVCRAAIYNLRSETFLDVAYPPAHMLVPTQSPPPPQEAATATEAAMSIQFGSAQHAILFTRAFVYHAVAAPYAVSALPLPCDNASHVLAPPFHERCTRPIEYHHLAKVIGLAVAADCLWNSFLRDSGNDVARATQLAQVLITSIDGAPFVSWVRDYTTQTAFLCRYLDGSTATNQAFYDLLNHCVATVQTLFASSPLVASWLGALGTDEASVSVTLENILGPLLVSRSFWAREVRSCYQSIAKLDRVRTTSASSSFVDRKFTWSYMLDDPDAQTEAAAGDSRRLVASITLFLRNHLAPLVVLSHLLPGYLHIQAPLLHEALPSFSSHNSQSASAALFSSASSSSPRRLEQQQQQLRRFRSIRVELSLGNQDAIASCAATLLFNLASFSLQSSSSSSPQPSHPSLWLVNTTPRTVTPAWCSLCEELCVLQARSAGDLWPEEVLVECERHASSIQWPPSEVVQRLVAGFLQRQQHHHHHHDDDPPAAWILWNVHRYSDYHLMRALQIVATALAQCIQYLRQQHQQHHQDSARHLIPQVVLVGALAWPNSRTLLNYQLRVVNSLQSPTISAAAAALSSPPPPPSQIQSWLTTVRQPCDCVLESRLLRAVYNQEPTDGRYLVVLPEHRLIALLVPTSRPVSAEHTRLCSLPPIVLLLHWPTAAEPLSSVSWPTKTEDGARAALLVLNEFARRGFFAAAAAAVNTMEEQEEAVSLFDRLSHISVEETADNRMLSTQVRAHYADAASILHVDATLAAMTSSHGRDSIHKLYSLIDATEAALIVHCTNHYRFHANFDVIGDCRPLLFRQQQPQAASPRARANIQTLIDQIFALPPPSASEHAPLLLRRAFDVMLLPLFPNDAVAAALHADASTTTLSDIMMAADISSSAM